MSEVGLERKLDHRLPTAVLGGSLSPNEESVVAACMDGVYTLKLSTQGSERQLYSITISYASSAHWLEDRDLILSGGYDGTAAVA